MNSSTKQLLLVAENISKTMGGEAAKNLIYYHRLKDNGWDVKVVCHGRVEEELKALLSSEDISQFFFIQDSVAQKTIWAIGKNFPIRLQELIFSPLIFIITQINMRQLVKPLIEEKKIQLIFQPTPNTPRVPSAMYNLGVPVVIGPLTGGMELPESFRDMDSSFTLAALNTGKFLSQILQRLMPGKLWADILIVANPATKKLLPQGYRGKVYEGIIESGVDLKLYQNATKDYSVSPQPNATVKFIFTGRLIDWKGVQFLLESFKLVLDQIDASLKIIGDGKLKQELQKQAEDLGISQKVHFTGWLTQEKLIQQMIQSDIFVMPSLRESGGNSILEAMAVGLPVITTNWGGPSKIVDDSCGKLIDPDRKADFIQNFAKAMIDLANSAETRKKMGEAGQKRLKNNYFDWDSKVKRIIEIFHEAIESYQSNQGKVI